MVGLLALAGLALAGCRADVSVAIEAGRDGGGTVRVALRLDKAAVAAVAAAGDVGKGLRTGDLAAAGWDVDVGHAAADGSVTVRAEHGFEDPAGLRALLDDVGGAGGPFRSLRLDRKRSFFRTTTTLRGTVDLTAGLAGFGDQALTEALGGQPFGMTDQELAEALGAPADRAFGLQVAVRLPGRLRSNAPTVTAGSAVWAPELGDATPLEATATTLNRGTVAATVAASAAALAVAAAAAVLAIRRARRRRTAG